MIRRTRRTLRSPAPRRRGGESTIALINIVFLLLVFFLVAGTLAAPRAPDVDPANADFATAPLDPAALYITADGTLHFARQGTFATGSIADFLGSRFAVGGVAPVEVVADRGLSAQALLATLGELQAAQAGDGLAIIVARPTADERQP